MADVSVFSPKTKLGESRSGHGISWIYNKTHREARKAQEKRRLERRAARAEWSNKSRGQKNEVLVEYPA